MFRYICSCIFLFLRYLLSVFWDNGKMGKIKIYSIMLKFICLSIIIFLVVFFEYFSFREKGIN